MTRKAAPKAKPPAQTGTRPKADHEYGIGEMSDGTINIFPASELPKRMAELRDLERAATEPNEKKSKGE